MAKTHKVLTQPAAETVVKPWTYNDEQRQLIEKLHEVRRAKLIASTSNAQLTVTSIRPVCVQHHAA